MKISAHCHDIFSNASKNLPEIAAAAGVILKESGGRWRGLCPFHSEKTPSFVIFPNNRFKCFGCGETGDAIDFIRKLKGFSFKEAVLYLGGEPARYKPKPPDPGAWKETEFNRNLTIMSDELRLLTRAVDMVTTAEPWERLCEISGIIHLRPFWESCLDVIISGSKGEKAKLYQRRLADEF